MSESFLLFLTMTYYVGIIKFYRKIELSRKFKENLSEVTLKLF